MLTASLQPGLLQSEVPLRRLVCVVDQHQPGMKPQTLGLLDHRLLVLPHKPSTEECSDGSHKRNGIKDIPRRDHINPARRSRHRSHRSQTGEPFVTAADRLVSPIRQHKVDRGRNRLAVDAKQLVRSAIT